MKKEIVTFIIFLVAASFFVAVSVQANSAFRYHVLYKNSKTYKMIHGEEEDKQGEPEDNAPRLDGWGNVVDEPPPPPPSDYNHESEARSEHEDELNRTNYPRTRYGY